MAPVIAPPSAFDFLAAPTGTGSAGGLSDSPLFAEVLAAQLGVGDGATPGAESSAAAHQPLSATETAPPQAADTVPGPLPVIAEVKDPTADWTSSTESPLARLLATSGERPPEQPSAQSGSALMPVPSAWSQFPEVAKVPSNPDHPLPFSSALPTLTGERPERNAKASPFGAPSPHPNPGDELNRDGLQTTAPWKAGRLESKGELFTHGEELGGRTELEVRALPFEMPLAHPNPGEGLGRAGIQTKTPWKAGGGASQVLADRWVPDVATSAEETPTPLQLAGSSLGASGEPITQGTDVESGPLSRPDLPPTQPLNAPAGVPGPDLHGALGAPVSPQAPFQPVSPTEPGVAAAGLSLRSVGLTSERPSAAHPSLGPTVAATRARSDHPVAAGRAVGANLTDAQPALGEFAGAPVPPMAEPPVKGAGRPFGTGAATSLGPRPGAPTAAAKAPNPTTLLGPEAPASSPEINPAVTAGEGLGMDARALNPGSGEGPPRLTPAPGNAAFERPGSPRVELATERMAAHHNLSALPTAAMSAVSTLSAALETAEGFRRIRQTADREAGPSPLPALPVSALMSSPTVLTSGAPAPVQAALTASPWSPQFGAELGSQVSTWAADGVQHAQLHLNPAELGPVEVHIRIDGQEAHVMLHATQSETREALQSSVPELQQALQREGLQLGQTDVRGGRGDQPSGKPEFQPRSHFTPPAPNEGANPSARQRQHGLLDLYA